MSHVTPLSLLCPGGEDGAVVVTNETDPKLEIFSLSCLFFNDPARNQFCSPKKSNTDRHFSLIYQAPEPKDVNAE